MYELKEEEVRVCKEIVNASFRVHKNLGPGLLEKVYEACLSYELEKAGLAVAKQVVLPIVYRDQILEQGLKLDLVVEDSVICEVKAAEAINPILQAQLMSYLKLAKKNIGFLINFNVVLIKDGIRRYCIE